MTRLAFDPHLPLGLITGLALIAILITAYGFYAGARGAWARGWAFAILLFALAGPILVHENHVPLPDVVALVMDRSQSMGIGDRLPQAEKALAQDWQKAFVFFKHEDDAAARGPQLAESFNEIVRQEVRLKEEEAVLV